MSRYDDNDVDALDRLEDLLDAYAYARLAPRDGALARIRVGVMAEAAAAAATLELTPRRSLMAPQPRPARPAPAPWFSRLAFTTGFAAVLTLGTSAAVLGAPPGSPFYNARVFLETALLPAQAEARSAGHEKLLDERMAEAAAAAKRGDTVALDAALVAFQTEVDSATADAGTDPAALAHLETVLAKHTAVLTGLEAGLPEQASIDRAIEASSKAITKLQEKAHPAHPSHPAHPDGSQGGGHQGNGSTSGSPQGGGTHRGEE